MQADLYATLAHCWLSQSGHLMYPRSSFFSRHDKRLFRVLFAAFAASATLLLAAPAFAQRPLGTDVSHYQGTINWTTVKNGGITFAWAKATESTGYTDPYFTINQNGARGVGNSHRCLPFRAAQPKSKYHRC